MTTLADMTVKMAEAF